MSYFPWEDNDREGFKNRYKNLEPYEVEEEASYKGKHAQQHVNVKVGKKHMHGGNKGQCSGKNKNKANAEYNKSGIERSQSEYQRGFLAGYAYAHNSGFQHVYGHSIWNRHADNNSGEKYGDNASRNNDNDGYHGYDYGNGDEHDGCHGFGYDNGVEDGYHGVDYYSGNENNYHGFGYDSEYEHSYHGFGYDSNHYEHGFEYDYNRSL